ncbi:PfaB family protein [Nostoc sp. KVJ3]|uniref:PfaB family protein n=1 Tax=Nostoc sp. KVJ3 TaxID=457945 RepID=UPI00223811F3|nr:PfaB family protein [Nostoc sp. KVJ3]MCW5319208.1 PfaB family protein [Nostoc sp. KVJ3]
MDKIAIVGLSCLFPGAKSSQEFWQNLIAGKDSTSELIFSELGVDPEVFYDQIKGKVDKFYSRQGGFIRDFKFNASEYNLPGELIKSLDDTYKWSLYATKQALEQSGYIKNQSVLSKCGVVLGNLSTPTKYSQKLFAPLYQQVIEAATAELLQQETFNLPSAGIKEKASLYNGMISSFPAALVAQAFSLSNINFCLDAACSSSFYAIKLASHYLWTHKADLMLAGAISCTDPLSLRMGFSIIQAYPDNGISRPFDKSSRGIITSDGVGIVVLKRYSDAIRDGDKILATICGNGLSNDGRGKHLLVPNSKGQILAFERAYKEAQISPKDIDYLECHATGTLVGDITELNSIESFFGKHQAIPPLGAAKGNVGHLLTAAGMVSLTKVIESMSNGVIPPSIHITEPVGAEQGLVSSQSIVTTPTAWQSKSSIKRAAISAFGFGGSNSHLILEQAEKSEVIDALGKTPKPIQPAKLAIVGMDAIFGSCDGQDAFERTIYNGTQHFISLPAKRWHGMEDRTEILTERGIDVEIAVGAYIKEFEIDTIACKIPPNEVEQLNPQHMLMLKVANRAIADAHIQEGSNVAIIIAADTELTVHGGYQRWHLSWQIKEGLRNGEITLSAKKITQLETILKDSLTKPVESIASLSYTSNLMATRISSLWNFSGASFTLSAGENSVFKALEVAQMLLSAGEVDAVVVGAVDLAGGLENVWLQNQFAKINRGTHTLSYDEFSNGWSIGEGAGAVVLKRHDIAQKNGDSIYAVIDAIGFAHHKYDLDKLQTGLPSFDAECVTKACQNAFRVAGIQASDIDYLEVFGSGTQQQDEAEIAGLLQAYGHSENGLDCAIGSVKANIGHTFIASGIASLIKTALCLHHKYIPPTPNWSKVKAPQMWKDSRFYVATESTPWFIEKEEANRVAAVNSIGIDGSYAHIIMSEEPNQKSHSSHNFQKTPFYLFPIASNTHSELLQELANLQQTIDNSSSLEVTATQTFNIFKQHQNVNYTLVILGHNKDELTKEMKFAHKGINNAFATSKDWQTPLGSYFTANPLGKRGEVSYVYPSSGTSFLGVGKDIFRLLPGVFDYLNTNNLNSRVAANGKLLYPRSLNKLSKSHLEALENQYLANGEVTSQIEIQIAGVNTTILQHIFQIQPKFAFGISLGEMNMIISQGVWSDSDLHQESYVKQLSYLFKKRLSGQKQALHEYWELSKNINLKDNDFWSSYILLTNPSAVEQSIKSETRVYITIISSPNEVGIAGEKQACQRVIKQLNCNAQYLPFDLVIHCLPMHSEYKQLVELNTLATKKTSNIVFYSAADYTPLNLERNQLAHSIAKMLCHQVDFPRLVNRVYEDGARIFIEVGSSNVSSRLINKILENKEHITVSLNQKGIDDQTSIIKALAKLVSHQVALNLSPLYKQSGETLTRKMSMSKTLTLGKHRIFDVILDEENRKIFQDIVCRQENLYSELEHEKYVYNLKEVQGFINASMTIISGKKNMNKALSEDALLDSIDDGNSQSFTQSPYKHVDVSNLQVFQAHAAFLQARYDSSKQINKIIELQISCVHNLLNQNNE